MLVAAFTLLPVPAWGFEPWAAKLADDVPGSGVDGLLDDACWEEQALRPVVPGADALAGAAGGPAPSDAESSLVGAAGGGAPEPHASAELEPAGGVEVLEVAGDPLLEEPSGGAEGPFDGAVPGAAAAVPGDDVDVPADGCEPA
jgi:hypothetical protein